MGGSGTRLTPAVQLIRLAVRAAFADRPGGPVAVACSGGADSLALLAAAARELDDVVALTVDHQLQAISAAQAERVANQAGALGVRSEVLRVTVAAGAGPEAAARDARHEALRQAAVRLGAVALCYGHTLDDQAETVLLGLARGSGPRSLQGMRPWREGNPALVRPLLEVTRSQTVQACSDLGLDWWTDPHNSDPRYTRVRVRERVLPVLEAELGPGVAAALARTAAALQEDSDALEALAAAVTERLAGDPEGWDVAALRAEPGAVRQRVLRDAAIAAGCPPADLTRDHVLALADLVAGGAGRKWSLPRVDAERVGPRLRFRSAEGR